MAGRRNDGSNRGGRTGGQQRGRIDDTLRHRLVGAAVLAALGILLIPVLLDDSGRTDRPIRDTNIPPRPAEEFSSRIIPLDAEPPPPAFEPPAASMPAGEAGTSAPVEGGEAAPRVGVTAWVVQLGSFAAEDNALALEKRLKDAGYRAFIEKLITEDGTVYRVRVGPELLRADARAVRERLEREIDLKGIVVRYP